MTPPADNPAPAAAVGRIPSGLFILTAGTGPDATAMLASWVQQCSFTPLRVTVAVAPDRPINAHLQPGAAFALNGVPEGKTDWLKHFGKGFAPGEPAFAGVAVIDGAGGVPTLDGAVAVMECRVAERVSAGDHDLIVADVLTGRAMPDGKPMVHLRKSGSHY